MVINRRLPVKNASAWRGLHVRKLSSTKRRMRKHAYMSGLEADDTSGKFISFRFVDSTSRANSHRSIRKHLLACEIAFLLLSKEEKKEKKSQFALSKSVESTERFYRRNIRLCKLCDFGGNEYSMERRNSKRTPWRIQSRSLLFRFIPFRPFVRPKYPALPVEPAGGQIFFLNG